MKATVILCDPEEHLPVVIDGRDRRAFERERESLGYSRGPIRQVAEEAPELYVAFLAWHALTRLRGDLGDFEVFESRLVEVTEITSGEEDEPRPTRPVR